MSAIYRAIVQGDLPQAIAAANLRRASLRSKPDEVYRIARVFLELGRRDELLDWCADLRLSPQYRFFAGYQLALALRDRGVAAGAAAAEACRDLTGSERDQIAKLLGVPSQPGADLPPPRHIAICGASFCGSTLFDIVMNGLPGVRTIGESHWLIKGWLDRKTIAYDVANPLGDHVPQCRSCGAGCPVLTPQFRIRLLADPANWYGKIARQLDARVLISADKNLPKITLNDPCLRFDAIVLYKSPLQAWASQAPRCPAAADAAGHFDQMTAYLSQWRTVYAELIDPFRPAGRKIFVNFDWLTIDPFNTFQAVTSALDLPFQADLLRAISPGHSIGGNRGTLHKVLSSDRALKIEPLGAPAIPASHRRWIEEHQETRDLYQALNARAIGPQPAA